MRKWFPKSIVIFICLYCLTHFSWLHAASVATLAPNCSDELLSSAHIEVSRLFGFTSVMLTGLMGVNTSVVSHEWAHAELAERIAFIERELKIQTSSRTMMIG